MIKSLDKIGVYGLEKQEAFDIIKDKCSDWDYNDLPIYRGSDLGYDNVLVNPSERLRTSANARFNIYTTLIDNSPLWKDYPKRSKSLICSFDKSYAENYSTAYRVIPFNNSNWGVCIDNDIWNSFLYINDYIYKSDTFKMNMFNDLVIQCIPDEYINHTFLFEDNIINSLKNTNKDNIITYPDTDNFSDYIYDNIEKYDNLYELLIDITDPVKNKFKNFKYSELIKNNYVIANNEVWTDSTAILVRDDILILIMNDLYTENYVNENKIITKFKNFCK